MTVEARWKRSCWHEKTGAETWDLLAAGVLLTIRRTDDAPVWRLICCDVELNESLRCTDLPTAKLRAEALVRAELERRALDLRGGPEPADRAYTTWRRKYPTPERAAIAAHTELMRMRDDGNTPRKDRP